MGDRDEFWSPDFDLLKEKLVQPVIFDVVIYMILSIWKHRVLDISPLVVASPFNVKINIFRKNDMSQIQKLPAFKAYDIRGRMPEQLNEFMVYCIGKAYAQVMKPQAP